MQDRIKGLEISLDSLQENLYHCQQQKQEKAEQCERYELELERLQQKVSVYSKLQPHGTATIPFSTVLSRKIACVKALRRMTGLGLLDAKNRVEACVTAGSPLVLEGILPELAEACLGLPGTTISSNTEGSTEKAAEKPAEKPAEEK